MDLSFSNFPDRSIPASELPSALDCLPLVFAPPAAVPHVVDSMIDEGPTKTPSLRFCPSSLMDGGQQDIANLEEWGSNVTLMRAELEKLLKEIKVRTTVLSNH